MVQDRRGKPLGRRIDDIEGEIRRGKAMYSTAANAIESTFGADHVGTAFFKTDAWELKPDVESRAGNIFGAIARFKAHPWTITAAEVGYRILNAFHPARSAQVHGIGYAGDFNGIRVVADAQRKSKMSINLGKGFIEGITPRTLEKRAGDLIRAVSMVVQRKEGEIEPK